MKKIKLAISIVLFLALTSIGYQIIQSARTNQQFKRDSAELNHFKYGLFSVNTWKDQLSTIISAEVDKLYLTRKNEKSLKNHLESQLEILIDKINERIKKTNSKTTKGRIKQSFMDTFVDVEDIKKGIPEYAKAILAEMSTPKTEIQVKSMLKERIAKYMKETFDTMPEKTKDQIISKYGDENEELAKITLEKVIERKHHVISELSMFMILIAVILFIMVGFSKGPLLPSQYIILTLTLLVMLVVGVTTPMIDMEAKITHLSFVLFDHPIEFKNQVLYFQSKSIIDVFWIMISHKEIQMKLVGVLMVGFSIVFPILKVISCFFYYYDYCKARKYKLVHFFVLNSGKWSMADVMVVSIFMAYIGFNGIINSQLATLAASAPSMEVLSTNGTNLQPGFYLFFSYTVLAMFLSNFLKNRAPNCEA